MQQMEENLSSVQAAVNDLSSIVVPQALIVANQLISHENEKEKIPYIAGTCMYIQSRNFINKYVIA